MSFIKYLLISRVASMSTSSGSSEEFDFVTTWLVIEFTLSQKLETSHVPIEILDAINIFGRHTFFFRFGSDFIMLCVKFLMYAFRKWSTLSILISSMLDWRNYSFHFVSLARSLWFLNDFFKIFSIDNFILFSISSAVGSSALYVSSSPNTSSNQPRSSFFV